MLIGAHVSTSGGLPKAVERGVELDCDAIQIFNQSPRMWRPTVYRDEDVKAFRERLAESRVQAVMIHAVYLINCGSEDAEIRKKSLTSLTHSLRTGQRIGSCGVVLHAGSAKTGDAKMAIARAGKTIRAALDDSEGCELHLEDTAGAGGTLGRSFAELAELIEAAGGEQRLGVCLDSCHLLASGYDIRTRPGMDRVLKEATTALGKGRIRSLHLNDSQTPLGSNRDRHANVAEGELGQAGCAAFLSEPSFKGMPCVLETPGVQRSGPRREEVALARKLLERGTKARKGAKATGASKTAKAKRSR
ncbi:MAG TPA: deoxyribonuclease IV [Solirubrobacteraceae bacterium]|jgi:deoxyribonuclease-4